MSSFWQIDIDRNKNEVSKYFFDRIDKCKIIKPNGEKQPVFEFIREGWRDACYTYSAYNIMGLKSTDRLVRGNIYCKNDIDDIINITLLGLPKDAKRPNYAHGWVEFDFKNKPYIYDNHYKYPILKQDWEKERSPYVITTNLTQAQIFDRLLGKYKDKIEVKVDGDRKEIITHKIYDNNDKDFLDTIYLNSKFVLEKGEVVDFEAEEIVSD